MTIEDQADKVRKVKRSQSAMIIDPVTLPTTALVSDANTIMNEYRIGGIPIVDDNGILIGIVTNRDLRFEKNEGMFFYTLIGCQLLQKEVPAIDSLTLRGRISDALSRKPSSSKRGIFD